MIAGLSIQVVTLLFFMGASIDFALNTMRRHKALGEAAFDQNPIMVKVRGSTAFRGFLVALGLSTICIFWRSVFRVAELSGGWTGPIMQRQDLFIGFEGVMIVVAALALNVFHPSFCFAAMMEGAGGFGSSKKSKKTTDAEVVEGQWEKNASDSEGRHGSGSA